MLNNQDELLCLIRNMHLAAADPDRAAWVRALGGVGDAIGGCSIIVVDHRLPNTVVDLAEVRVPPAFIDYTLRNLGQRPKNAFLQELPGMPVGVPLVLKHGDDPARDVDRFRAEHLHEFLRSTGLTHFLSTILERDGHAGRSIMVGLARGAAHGSYRPAEIDLYRRLLPHLTAACLVRRRLAEALAAAQAPRRVLELLDRAIVLVDAAGRVAYANPAADKVLARRDGLAVERGGGLTGARPGDTGRLRRLIRAAAAAATGDGLEGGGVVALPRPQGRPYVVQVLPLAPGTDLASVPHLALWPEAVLLISDPESRCALPHERLRHAYGLTRAEAALAVRLVEGMGLRAASQALEITENTAKAQLKAVFAKLDVDRQSALVRRVLGDFGGVGTLTAEQNGHG